MSFCIPLPLVLSFFLTPFRLMSESNWKFISHSIKSWLLFHPIIVESCISMNESLWDTHAFIYYLFCVFGKPRRAATSSQGKFVTWIDSQLGKDGRDFDSIFPSLIQYLIKFYFKLKVGEN